MVSNYEGLRVELGIEIIYKEGMEEIIGNGIVMGELEDEIICKGLMGEGVEEEQKNGVIEEFRDNIYEKDIDETPIKANKVAKGKYVKVDGQALKVLIIAAQKGDKKALEELLELCKPLVYKKALTFHIVNHDDEDLLQIARVSVLKAIYGYDTERNISFFHYVATAVKNNFYYMVRNAEKDKRSSSLNVILETGGEAIHHFQDSVDIEGDYINKETRLQLKKFLDALQEEEKDFMLNYAMYYGGITRYAKEHGINNYAAQKKKDELLDRLRRQFIYCEVGRD